MRRSAATGPSAYCCAGSATHFPPDFFPPHPAHLHRACSATPSASLQGDCPQACPELFHSNHPECTGLSTGSSTGAGRLALTPAGSPPRLGADEAPGPPLRRGTSTLARGRQAWECWQGASSPFPAEVSVLAR